MKLGTPSFVGARLREAREARGLTAVTLAELLGVTRAAVSLWETGNASPHPDIMHKIADKLKLPVPFFLMPFSETKLDTVFHRSMSSATKAARLRGERRYEWLSKIIVSYLREFVDFPRVNLPCFELSVEPKNLPESEIEAIALNVRRFWGLGDGPISNVILLLENNGALVTRIELGASTLDAFSAWCSSDSTPYIVLGTEKSSAVRSRFDAAHELAHLVLHRYLDRTSLNNASDFRLIEDQANRFASAFLVPNTAFAEDLYASNLDILRALKDKWRVSIAMMIKRADDLGFLSKQRARRMWVNYNRRGWRRQEPMDDELEVEQPRVLRRAFELLLGEGVQAPEQLLSALPLAPNDIEELANLPHGLLRKSLPLVELKNYVQGVQKETTADSDFASLQRYSTDQVPYSKN